jgi:hypothetical protein
VAQALDRVRKAARQRKKEQFTSLLHHLNVDTLRTAYYALKRKAAAGVDGVTWQDYEARTLSHGLRMCTDGSIKARTVRNPPAGRTYRRRTGSSGR